MLPQPCRRYKASSSADLVDRGWRGAAPERQYPRTRNHNAGRAKLCSGSGYEIEVKS